MSLTPGLYERLSIGATDKSIRDQNVTWFDVEFREFPGDALVSA